MKRRTIVRAALALATLGGLGGLVVASGVVPTKASSGHWGVTAWFLKTAMKRSVATHSIGIEAPPLDEPRLVLVGAGHYETGCRMCHGVPGMRLPPVTHAMTPPPPDLSKRVADYDDGELFTIIRHGVKFTGMPAWPAIEREDEVWAMVAFMRELPKLDANAYGRLVHGEIAPNEAAPAVVVRHCARCHGLGGEGRGTEAFPRLSGQRAEYLRASLEAYARGERHSGIMEPVASPLSPGDIDAAARWYGEQLAIPSRAALVVADPRGEAIAQRGIPERRVPACSDCHGPRTDPQHAGYPRLAGQYAPYIVQQLQLFRAGKRGGTKFAGVMREVIDEHALDDEQVRAVASYFAGLPSK